MHKFTRRQVSSELNYPKMYNIYKLRQVTSKQQVSKKMFFFLFVYCLISWLCSLSIEARNWVSNYSYKLETNIIEHISVA